MSADLTFGSWLKRRRRGLGLTQVELGRQTGYAGETIRKVEADEFRPSREMAEILAATLDISPEYRARFVRFARGEGEDGAFALDTDTVSMPPPPLAPAYPNLPVPPTPLIGRERELAAVESLVLRDEVRLVTLTGAGGTGKTQLVLAVAGTLLGHFPDGVYLVELAPIRDPTLVASAIAAALDVREVAGQPLLQVLIEHLRTRQLLLVLDNFEHLLHAALTVGDLLAACPHLKVLATSRAPLRILCEHEFPVAPLAVPARGAQTSTVKPALLLSTYPSVDLFVQRAEAVQPNFALTDDNADAVIEICQRLDGLPLALELAAARVRLLPPHAIAARLTHRLQLLKGGPRDAPARQQTMRDTITWSYDLLDDSAKTLFRRLAVFVGGCSLEAVEAVYAGLGEPEVDVLDRLASLAEQSLLQHSLASGDQPRFTMLETIREYALERLEASGEAAAVRRQHLAFYGALAEAFEPEKWSSTATSWGDRLKLERDNLRSALEWGLGSSEGEDVDAGALLAGDLWYFWYGQGDLHEGRNWLTRATGSAAGRERGRALALLGMGMFGTQQGDSALAYASLQESVALWRELGDMPHLTEALHIMGHVVFDQRKHDEARRLFAESLAYYQQVGDVSQTITLTSDLGLVALHEGNLSEARTRYEVVIDAARANDLKDALGGALERLGDLDRLDGDFGCAAERYETSLELFGELGNKLGAASNSHKLGRVALHNGEYERARGLLTESLSVQVAEGNRQGIAECLAGLGSLAAAEGKPRRAAHLLAAARALLDAIGAPLSPPDQLAFDHDVASVREQLEPSDFARCWEEGQKETQGEAVAYALETPSGDEVAARPT
ncbi:MAG: tetratricopeptide repeat protein [Anaerolineae bacterium]